jgi:hypothetical protein
MKFGGPGVAAKVNVTEVSADIVAEVGLTVIVVTSPITLAVAVPLRP